MELQHKLKIGDRKEIHRLTGVPVRTVRAIISGERNADTPTGKKVIDAANAIVNQREKMLTQFNRL